MMILTDPRERGRFLRFAVVGGIGAVVDFGTFNLLATLLNVPAVWASVLSFTAAIVSNFIWNRYWTYPDSRSKAIVRQVMEFSAVSVTGLLIRTPIFALSEGPFQRLFESFSLDLALPPEFLGHNMALALAVGVVMFWNFFINRYWTYADVD
jgi:putative flippase GtrA